jgi:hypothetical protein
VDSLGVSPFKDRRDWFHRAVEDNTVYFGRNSPPHVINDIVANGSSVRTTSLFFLFWWQKEMLFEL